MPTKWYAAHSITPADDHSLQNVPNPGDYTDLQTGDMCILYIDGHGSMYTYDETDSTVEEIPARITPNGNSGPGRWQRKRMGQGSDFFNGTIGEQFNALVTSNGTVVTLDLEKQGGGDLTAVIPEDVRVLPAQSIALTAGSDASPTGNYVYVLASAPTVLAKSTSDWPTANHIKISYCLVPSATYVQSHGCYVNQNWNDGTGHTGVGQLAHLGENIRLTLKGASWHSGVSGNGATDDYITLVTADTPDSAYFLTTSGFCYQMHKHTVPAFDSETDEILCVNSNSGAYTPRNDIRDETVDASGGTLTNKYYNVVFWMVANKSGEYAPCMMNMPTGSYVGLGNATNDVDGHDVYDMPRQFVNESATGFLVCRITFRQTAAGITVENTTDLRGRTPGTASGTSGGTTEFADNQFKLYSVADITKIVDYDLSGLTTANTRTIEVADADMIIPTGSLAGATELNYNGVKALETTATGVSITDATYNSTLQHGGVDFTIFNTELGGSILLNGMSAGGSPIDLAEFDPDQGIKLYRANLLAINADVAVNLYYSGVKVLNTTPTGVHIGVGTDLLHIQGTGGALYLDSLVHGATLNLRGENLATGTMKSLVVADPDGAAEFYYAGVKAFETTPDGVKFGLAGLLTEDAGTLTLRSDNWGADFLLQLDSIGGTARSVITGNPDAAVELYHAGTKTFETQALGFKVQGVGSISDHQQAHGNGYFITNGDVSGLLYLRGTNSGSATTTLIIASPDGAVDLYHAGVKKLSTTGVGVTISNGTDDGYIQMDATYFRMYNPTHGATINLVAEDTGGTPKTLLLGDPDGAAELYYAGVKTLETSSSGIKVSDTSGASTNVLFYDDSSNLLGTINNNAGTFKFFLGAGGEDSLKLNLNGAVELYYDNVLRASTLDDGFTVHGCLTIDEITTPTADADHGKVYTKADNKLYFQDGAGAEHEIAFVP